MFFRFFTVLLAGFSVCSVDCLTCLQCTDIQSPRHCKYAMECQDGEVCNVHRTTNPFGDVVFGVGCVHHSACSNRSQVNHACDECCSTDLCNAAGCGLSGYPSIRGPVCYSCPAQITDGTCHKIDVCGINEVCMINEQSEFGDTVYTSQCVGLTYCERHTIDVSQIIGRSILDDTRSLAETTCHKCCHDDLCNAFCVTDYCEPNPCEHGTCVNGRTKYTCVCDPFHTGRNCTDVNYCTPNPCDHGNCVNGRTNYTCLCDPSHTGRNCTDFSYCTPNPCEHGTCVNGRTNYTCVCDPSHTGRNCTGYLHDCMALRNFTNVSGVYRIGIDGNQKIVEVYCDMETDGGGWTVFQRRVNGSVDFYQNFSTYENGFGDVHGEFWLGLKNIYAMTSTAKTELRIVLMDANGYTAYEVFPNFRLSAAPNYTLHVDQGHGTAGDKEGLSWHSGHPFYTYDHDDAHDCARTRHGGWWYHYCAYVNLNGQYVTPGTIATSNSEAGIHYESFRGDTSMKEAKMMLRRV